MIMMIGGYSQNLQMYIFDPALIISALITVVANGNGVGIDIGHGMV